MESSMIAKIIAFGVYLAFMVIMGLKYMKKNNSTSDYFLGGRSVGPWMTALSAEASDMSGWLLMGLPGLAYLGGMKEAVWTAIGLILGTYLNWLIVAKPLRRATVKYGDALTIPEFLTNRYKEKKHIISSISVVFLLLFFTIYTASGMVACAKLFNSVFGLDYLIGLIIGFMVLLVYTILGGYLAVVATDFVQGLLMLFAAVITGLIIVFALGGPADAIAKVSEFSQKAISGEFGEAMKAKFIGNQSYSGMSIASALAWGLGYFGMPHILVRFMSVRSEADIKKSRIVATTWVILAFIFALVIGAFGTAFLLQNGQILEGANNEKVFSNSIQVIFPAFIAGIFTCGILAAAMSTADSQLLAASSAFSRDFFKGFVRKDASETEILLVSRLSVLVIAIVAFILAFNPNSSIFGLVSYAWAGFGATFGPLVLLSLFWKGGTKEGAIAGLIGGGVTVVLWHNMAGGIFDIYEILPGFIVCAVLMVVVSLLTKKDPEVVAEYESYKSGN